MSKKAKIAILVIILVSIAAYVFYILKKSSGPSIEVSVTTIEKGDITKTVSGSGYIQPEVDVDIAARISSEIMKIHVIEGEYVQKGQVLAELDKQRYEALVEEAESRLMSAKAGLKKAEADFARTNDLFAKNLTTKADLDAVEATKLSAQSQVQQANAYLKQTNDDLSKTLLTAPIAGTVTKLLKEEGEMAVGSQFQADPIMTVSDLSRMEVLSEIDENDVVLVNLNDETSIEIDAIPDTTFEGKVSEIAHTATTRGRGTQEQVTNFEVKIAVTSKVEKLRPGMSATVDIKTETHENILFVPIQCVTARSADDLKDQINKEENPDTTATKEEKTDNPSEKELQEVVFVVKDGIAKITPVKTGISDDTNIEILSGVEEGDKVVSGSYKALSRLLKDGSKVEEKKGKEHIKNDKKKD